MQKNPNALVRPISTNSLALFAGGGTQSAVTPSFNESVATHNGAVAQWESDYGAATTTPDPSTAIALAASLGLARLQLAVDAVNLVNSKISLRGTIRSDYAAASPEVQRAASACGLPCLDEAGRDLDEYGRARAGLGSEMDHAI